MAFNNLLASPGFAAWLRGEPLDVDRAALHRRGQAAGRHPLDRPPLRPERMFFVSLLLNQVLGWMRSKTGTTSLRAILYMDEVFGYLPPVADPPSKRPLLTLLKQARAFGLGVVLATQNPVDLDYKGLSNVGTWFLGRLQTERDKQRADRRPRRRRGRRASSTAPAMEQTLAGLGNRVFLLHNVHEDEPVLFQTRWALSYLRGPLTRPEIKRLMDPVKQAPAAAPVAAQQPTGAGIAAAAASPTPVVSSAPEAGEAVPVLPPDVPQSFLPVRSRPQGIAYEPYLFAAATVHYLDAKRGIDHAEELSLLAPLTGDGADWYAAEAADLGKGDLDSEPVSGARFASLPAAAVKARSYDAWRKALEECLYRTRRCELFKSDTLGRSRGRANPNATSASAWLSGAARSGTSKSRSCGRNTAPRSPNSRTAFAAPSR